MNTKKTILKEFQKMPNVGPAVSRDLYLLGLRSVTDLKSKDPEKLYKKLEKITGTHVDRCMLYVLRSLVCMACSGERDTEKVAWWRFKDIPTCK